jgi:hypothetical protein
VCDCGKARSLGCLCADTCGLDGDMV